MEDFGEAKHDWLKTFLELRCGIPSHDTFKRVFQALDPASFLECFVRWTQSLRAIEFAQIKNMTLDDALVVEPSVFHDTPIEMVLAILATLGTTQKHDGVGS